MTRVLAPINFSALAESHLQEHIHELRSSFEAFMDLHKPCAHGKPLELFCYGSLMWHRSFEVISWKYDVLPDYCASFCVPSFHWRGTPECPGAVLGAHPAPGTSIFPPCNYLFGKSFSIAPCSGILWELWVRELIAGTYEPVFTDGKLIFIVKENLKEPLLTPTSPIDLLPYLKGVGLAGSAQDYLDQYVEQLQEMARATPFESHIMDQLQALITQYQTLTSIEGGHSPSILLGPHTTSDTIDPKDSDTVVSGT